MKWTKRKFGLLCGSKAIHSTLGRPKMGVEQEHEKAVKFPPNSTTDAGCLPSEIWHVFSPPKCCHFWGSVDTKISLIANFSNLTISQNILPILRSEGVVLFDCTNHLGVGKSKAPSHHQRRGVITILGTNKCYWFLHSYFHTPKFHQRWRLKFPNFYPNFIEEEEDQDWKHFFASFLYQNFGKVSMQAFFYSVAYFARLVHTLTTSDFSFSYFSETKMLSIGWHIWMLVFWVLKGGSFDLPSIGKISNFGR